MLLQFNKNTIKNKIPWIKCRIRNFFLFLWYDLEMTDISLPMSDLRDLTCCFQQPKGQWQPRLVPWHASSPFSNLILSLTCHNVPRINHSKLLPPSWDAVKAFPKAREEKRVNGSSYKQDAPAATAVFVYRRWTHLGLRRRHRKRGCSARGGTLVLGGGRGQGPNYWQHFGFSLW